MFQFLCLPSLVFSLEVSGSEEIVIIKYFEDNTSDFIPSISFFDEIDYQVYNSQFIFYENNTILKPPFYFITKKTNAEIKIINYDKRPHSTSFYNTTEITFSDTSSMKNNVYINTNYFDIKNYIEASPENLTIDTSISFYPVNYITMDTPFLYTKQKITSGLGFQYQKGTIDLHNHLLFASPVFSFKPQITTISYNRFDNFYCNGQMIISDEYLENEIEIMFRNKYLFAGINNHTSVIDYNKIYSIFGASISLYIQNHTISLFSKTTSDLKYSFNQSSLFFQKNYSSGIEYTIEYNHFFISNTSGITGLKHPLEISSNHYEPDVPSIILQTKGGYINSYFLFSSELNLLYSLNNTIEYSSLIAMKDLHFFNCTIDIANRITSNNFNYFIRFDNNVKISYRLNYFGILYFDANLSTEFANTISNKSIFKVGCLFTF